MTKCPTCGNQLENPERPCPVCLLRYAAEDTMNGENNDRESPGYHHEPEISLVQAAFPELEILEKIGSGGMGTVFKAFQPKLDRFVALKILYTELAEKPAFAERFAREGKLLARLSHQNIVTIYDYGKSSPTEVAGFFYLMMEYVDGVNLRQAMRGEKFSPEQAFSIVPKICEALQYAHDEGVLHRDIKPENILLDTKGRIKIADFGIGKLQRDSETPDAPGPENEATDIELRTNSGAVLGTLRYMAPEQLRSPDKVDHRADIYSLGVVFYELLTGELPQRPIRLPSEKSAVDKEVDGIVLKAMDNERTRRHNSASEMKTEIETAASRFSERPKDIVPSTPPSSGKTPRGPILALVLVIASITGLFVVQSRYAPFFSDYRAMENQIDSLVSMRYRVDMSVRNQKNVLESESEQDDEIDREVAAIKYEKLEKWSTETKNREVALKENMKRWKSDHIQSWRMLLFWLPIGLSLLMGGCTVYGFMYLRNLRTKTEKPGIMPLIFAVAGFVFFAPMTMFFINVTFTSLFNIAGNLEMMTLAWFAMPVFFASLLLSLFVAILLIRFLITATRTPESGTVHYSRAYAALGVVLAGILLPVVAAFSLISTMHAERSMYYSFNSYDGNMAEEFMRRADVISKEVDDEIFRKIGSLETRHKNLAETRKTKLSEFEKRQNEMRGSSPEIIDTDDLRRIIETFNVELAEIDAEGNSIISDIKRYDQAIRDSDYDYRNMRDFFMHSYRNYDRSWSPSKSGVNIISVIIGAICCAAAGIGMAADYLFRHRRIKGLKGRIPAVIATVIVPVGLLVFGIFVLIAWLSTLNGQTAIAVSIGILSLVILALGTAGLIGLFWTRSRPR